MRGPNLIARVSSALKFDIDISGKEEDIPSRKGSMLQDGPGVRGVVSMRMAGVGVRVGEA